jgi:glutamate 5-kinase
VACLSADGIQIARGLINYGSSDARRIARHASQDIEAILGYVDEAEIIHRDNLILC